MTRKLLLIPVLALAGIFCYANLRFVNPSAALEPIDVVTFEVKNHGHLDPGSLGAHIRQKEEIRAFSLNADQSVLGVTYQYQKLNESDLINHLSYNGQLEISKKVFAASDKPQCPVHGVMAKWEYALNMMRVMH